MRSVGRAFSALGARQQQLDRFVVWEGRHKTAGFVAVYAVMDGHCGAVSVDVASTHLTPLLLRHAQWQLPSPNVLAVLEDAVNELERLVTNATEHARVFDGSTLTVVVVAGGDLFLAHLGDSRAGVVSDEDALVWISHEHRVTAAPEAQRLRAVGADVRHGRLLGPKKHLDVSRALGDRDHKSNAPHALVAVPQLLCHRVRPHDRLLLLGTDGLWNIPFLDDSDFESMANTAALAHAHPSEQTKAFVEEALRFSAQDNVTLVLITLHTPYAQPEHLLLPRQPPLSGVTYDRAPPVAAGFECTYWETSAVGATLTKHTKTTQRRSFLSFLTRH
ncbi:phosphatase 2C 22 [Gracilariopsis chorda]|uniref:Phosphatase 2C 22 n=1 Tax=Gracilariopsis chorda TaxID=448386 RepID=A0A2V3IXF1_9FLOR|nr:phosphatase 2C 22 [Gracilariopsis chorda]|eukprot:PXF45810.1 phosphatase 2C 22 [Gracilariopsis chorda]